MKQLPPFLLKRSLCMALQLIFLKLSFGGTCYWLCNGEACNSVCCQAECQETLYNFFLYSHLPAHVPFLVSPEQNPLESQTMWWQNKTHTSSSFKITLYLLHS